MASEAISECLIFSLGSMPPDPPTLFHTYTQWPYQSKIAGASPELMIYMVVWIVSSLELSIINHSMVESSLKVANYMASQQHTYIAGIVIMTVLLLPLQLVATILTVCITM